MITAQMTILPVLLLLIYVYRCDVCQKEPIGLLMKVFFYGFFAVSIGAIIGESILTLLGGYFTDSEMTMRFLQLSVFAPFMEESLKFWVLVKLIWRNPNFDEYFDGIVYAAYVSLGFACLENILYVIGGGMEVAVSRAIFSVPGHFFFSAIMGYFLALARFKPQKSHWYLGLAVGGAMAAHACFNGILCVIDMDESIWSMIGFILFFLVLWRMAVARLNRLSLLSRENWRLAENSIIAEEEANG